MYPITTLSASLLALIFISISIRIIKLRYKHQISIGSGGNEQLARIIRGHGNFAEYVPIALILMLCAEANQANPMILGGLAVIFVLGRLLHAYAFVFDKMYFKSRFRGMILTFGALILLAVLDIFYLVSGFISH